MTQTKRQTLYVWEDARGWTYGLNFPHQRIGGFYHTPLEAMRGAVKHHAVKRHAPINLKYIYAREYNGC